VRPTQKTWQPVGTNADCPALSFIWTRFSKVQKSAPAWGALIALDHRGSCSLVDWCGVHVQYPRRAALGNGPGKRTRETNQLLGNQRLVPASSIVQMAIYPSQPLSSALCLLPSQTATQTSLPHLQHDDASRMTCPHPPCFALLRTNRSRIPWGAPPNRTTAGGCKYSQP
jgi:hypothetical protein